MTKVHIVNGSAAYGQLFLEAGFTLSNADEAELVCFTGGEDVSPNLYGDKRHNTTHNNPHRDFRESELFKDFLARGLPMVGICRGAQFLNVMAGGRMYQNVTRHTAPHYLTDLRTGTEVWVTSTHHQMMMPGDKGKVIGASYLHGDREWFDGEVARRDQSDEDNEVVLFKRKRLLCFQPHPEMYQNYSEYDGMREYFFSLVNELIKG